MFCFLRGSEDRTGKPVELPAMSGIHRFFLSGKVFCTGNGYNKTETVNHETDTAELLYRF